MWFQYSHRCCLAAAHSFKFDIDICKQAFDYYDTNKSGTLDSGELMRLAEVLWDTFYPNGPKIDAQTKAFMVMPQPRNSLDCSALSSGGRAP